MSCYVDDPLPYYTALSYHAATWPGYGQVFILKVKIRILERINFYTLSFDL